MTVDVRFKTRDHAARSPCDDKTAGPGGGKEFFAQLAGAFDQTADVTDRRARRTATARRSSSDVPVAPPNIGQRTATFAYGNPSYEEFAKTFVVPAIAGYKFFAGPRDDAFYVNLAQIFDLGAFVGLNTLNGQPFRSRIYDVDPTANGMFANTDPTKAPDGVAGFNVHSHRARDSAHRARAEGQRMTFQQAVDAGMPSNKTLFGVWASASRRASRTLVPAEPRRHPRLAPRATRMPARGARCRASACRSSTRS